VELVWEIDKKEEEKEKKRKRIIKPSPKQSVPNVSQHAQENRFSVYPYIHRCSYNQSVFEAIPSGLFPPPFSRH
jgi:hypothetical protein